MKTHQGRDRSCCIATWAANDYMAAELFSGKIR
jgi:hypothetical protein